MSRENFAAAPDGLAEGVAGLARPYAGRNLMNYFIPGSRDDFLIDAAVGEDFDAMFEQRDQDQDPGMISGIVKPMLGKGGEAGRVYGFGDAAF
jgi:hypothetical protein